MSPRTTARTSRTRTSRLHPPSGIRRPGLHLAAAAAGAVLVGVVTGGEPPASAEPMESVSVAAQLGIPADSAADSAAVAVPEQLDSLEQLAASRSERDAEQAAAAAAQQAADAEAARKAAEEAARAEAARKAAEEQAAQEEAARAAAEEEAAREEESAAAAPAPAGAPAGSFQDYAMARLGGDGGQFSCLESLWGKESGWNPDAQNPTSTAYGIPQFLDSTWAGTGIAKTSDGYRQIDAGLIYITSRYGSPCGAWEHSQAVNWY